MRIAFPSTLLCLMGMLCPAALRAETPNIVVILCDDLGYGDFGCYNANSKIATPNVDRLAARGIRFTDAHTPSAVCTLAICAAILEAKLPADAGEDSISFLPTLLNRSGAGMTRRFSVHHSSRGVFALREGPWKFVPSRGSGGFSTPRSVTPRDGEPEGQLYHLEDDPAETHNVWQHHPAIVTRLAERLRTIQAGPGTATPP